ncbi:MAG: AI-2E family transporter [Hyphomicrobiales bacterium]
MVNKVNENDALRLSIDIVVKLGLLSIIVFWCAKLISPFVLIVVWAAVLAVALFPVYNWLKRILGGRGGWSATIIVLIGVLLIFGPVSALVLAMIENLQFMQDKLAAGDIKISPPSESVAEWPIIGKQLSKLWTRASVDLGAVLTQFKPQIKEMGSALLGMVANTGLGALQMIASIIIAGIFFGNAENSKRRLTNLSERIMPNRGSEFVDLAGATVRNVARGVVGISLLQAFLAGIGLTLAGIPFAGILTFLCLILAIIQVGPALVIIPAVIYAWSAMEFVPALIFTLYIIPVMIMDNFLKPIVMARGLSVPMLVIFLGVIGGTLAHGILGLFIGPVVLSLGYEMMMAWIGRNQGDGESEEEAEQAG